MAYIIFIIQLTHIYDFYVLDKIYYIKKNIVFFISILFPIHIMLIIIEDLFGRVT